MLRLALGVVLAAGLLWQPIPTHADTTERLVETLRLDEVIEIMRLEGLDHGAEIGESLLGPRAGRAWTATVSAIYREEALQARFASLLEAALEGDAAVAEDIEGFFGSETGQRILELEIGARRAMLDPAVDEDARSALVAMRAEEAPRLELLERFAAANDLIEQNVAGGLNSTFAFYTGLRDGGAPGFDIGEKDMLADVWGQEEEIRADLEEWLFAYLALAYGPLEDGELDAYIAFSELPSGQALNAALFAAFNGLFEETSWQLGQAAGQLLASEDI